MKVLCFGEILWDVFGEDKKIGGAPLNFGAHLKKNGVSAYMYSSVGKDELGAAAEKIAEKLEVNTKYVSAINFGTSVSLVSLVDGTPSYEIKLETAMDNIAYSPVTDEFDGFYFGSLAQRSEVSANTLKKIIDNNSFAEVFFDINIRQNFYSLETVDFSLKNATIFKISREEIGVLSELGIAKSTDYEDLCKELKQKYDNLKIIIITLDKDGAFVYSFENGCGIYSEKPKSKVVSTVGAGDSFSATFFASYLKGERIEKCLERAVKVSDFVVTTLGAIPDYPKELTE